MKSYVVALALAAAAAASLAPATAAVSLSDNDRKIYRDAFLAADKDQFDRARAIASGAQHKLLGKVIRWMEYTEARSGASFADITNFIRENPDWPQMSTLQRRAEEAITVATPEPLLVPWFEKNPPVTVDGKMAYGEALLNAGQRDQAVALLRDAWITGNFGVLQERTFVAKFGSLMREQDHVARLDRLLWDRQEEAAQRMILRVDMPHRLLAQARLALINNAAGVEAAVDKVPAELQGDPGLIYERVRWRRQKDLDDGAAELLLHRSANNVRPETWWAERNIVARRMLQRGHVSKAYELAKRHGLRDGTAFAEAEWLAGWIALRYLDERPAALAHFRRMYDSAATPMSKARGAYWIGRTAEAMKEPAAAENWYEQAAHFGHTYYGQLATLRLGGNRQLRLPPEPHPSRDEAEAFEKQELVRVVRLLVDLGRVDQVGSFVLRLIDIAKTPAQRALAASLAASTGRAELAVTAARRSERDGVTLISHGWPLPKLDVPRNERALVLALIRQESNYNHNAVSSVGARGLMQLMPATARQMAKSLKVNFVPDRLHDPHYNVQLGSAYLADLLDNYNGSYVLSLAAYNAGPGRVRGWIRDYGDPRAAEVDAVDWVENIPFSETRNYVQRVLESVQVYRRRLNDGDASRSIERDLKR